ncbi:hypothetical protein CDAR_417761 [Caerostris darwini]|uniref:Uncharacterized protein n=1 Tax=Caerostris darwini TaxID=1538125 RepID=A0AAV4PSQ5_9ARAC|nr:hypothetical protein CDAR_417761 [Caerostris darwini]
MTSDRHQLSSAVLEQPLDDAESEVFNRSSEVVPDDQWPSSIKFNCLEQPLDAESEVFNRSSEVVPDKKFIAIIKFNSV